MSEVTDSIKTLDEALAIIETLEAQKAHLLKVIKERKLAGYTLDLPNGGLLITKIFPYTSGYKPVYYISDEYDAAGILITPEVRIET